MSILADTDLTAYLQACEVIDSDNQEVQHQAMALRTESGAEDDHQLIRACFNFVRDEILHSSDHQIDVITCRASEVLKAGTGYCFAKSHLLCALLRANGFAAGLSYQRLCVDAKEQVFSLHGLTSVYLSGVGWHRVDPRGNKEGVDAQFQPPDSPLAFELSEEGEYDLDGVFATPLKRVVEVLQSSKTVAQVTKNLPDV